MDGWLQDLRFAGRRLVRHPLLSLTAIAALALGISASSAVFSIIHGVLLEPLPVAEPDRLLYLVSTRVDRGGHYTVVYPSFAGWRRARSFEHLIATRETTRVLTRANEAERLASTAVPAEYFEVLGVEPALGRPFADDERGVVLLSHALWQQRFGGTPDVLGQSIELDGEAHSVIGVMPPGLRSTFLGWKDLWTPLVVDETAALAEPLRGLRVLGRLAEGVSLTDARRELESLAAQMETDDPSRHQGWRAAMHPVAWWITGDAEKPLWWVFAASLLVLLIAGATVSNLLHALAATRRREIAVRRALGAGRSLLVRQMLLEGLVLSLVGGLAGVGLAFVGIRTLPHLAALELPRLGEVAIDSTVLSASLATTLAVGLLAGLAPSLAATRGAQSAPQGGRQTTESPGGRRIRQTLIAGQTALATLAIVASALLVRSLHELRAVEPGFAPDNLLTARIELPGGGPEDKATRITLLRELLRRLEALPGVEQAAASGQRLPLTGGHGTFELYVEGQPRGPRPELIVTAQMVSADYFETLGVPLLRGRRFADDETWESDQAVIVNQTMADRFWPDQDPIGRFIEWSNNDRAHVVGVVGNVRQLALHLEPAAEAYLAWGSVPSSQALVLRTSVAPTSLLGAARREATALMPGVIVHGVASGRGLLSSSYADRLLPVWLTTLLAGLAQGLGLLGLYGVVANSVARKTPEIGLRVALGAWPARIVRWVVGHGLRPVLVGLVLGLAVALVATRALTSQLYGVTATDPLAFLSGAALILATAIAVCAVPARRAARIDPATALRR